MSPLSSSWFSSLVLLSIVSKSWICIYSGSLLPSLTLAKSFIDFDIVAEKSKVWTLRGRQLIIWSTCYLKPISSIRSTSSITNTLILLPSKLEVSSRCYKRRPGVATMIFIVAMCSRSNSTSLPPMIRAALKSCRPPKDLSTSKAYIPSSRVGTKMSAPSPSN